MVSYSQSPMLLDEHRSAMTSLQPGSADSFSRKTKIICTMGPCCWDVDMLVKLIDAGMNVCRLNFSHGDHEGHGATVKRIREACKQRPDKPVAILLDTKGPEIRTGFFREDVGSKIELKEGQELKLVTDYDFKGDNTTLAMTYKDLPTAVKPGQVILCADGSLSLRVKSCGEDHVVTEVMNDIAIGERKNMNLPGVKVALPVLQEKDKKDLLAFGIPQGVDFVAASFVQDAEDVKLIRSTLGLRGRSIKIISKIENQEGINNIDEIIAASDGIMVARGDMGMEIDIEKVGLVQKMIIAKCNVAGKFVVTATQMLDSMERAPRPTRAEATDVLNAVLDGTDVVMLSGETANGKFPETAVMTMRRICQQAEAVVDHKNLFASKCQNIKALLGSNPVPPVESTCCVAVKAALDSNLKLIVALTETGSTARLLAKYQPHCPILAITASESTVRQLLTTRGVTPVLTASFVGTDSVITKALKLATSAGMVSSGDVIVAIHGTREECPGHANLMKMVAVP